MSSTRKAEYWDSTPSPASTAREPRRAALLATAVADLANVLELECTGALPRRRAGGACTLSAVALRAPSSASAARTAPRRAAARERAASFTRRSRHSAVRFASASAASPLERLSERRDREEEAGPPRAQVVPLAPPPRFSPRSPLSGRPPKQGIRRGANPSAAARFQQRAGRLGGRARGWRRRARFAGHALCTRLGLLLLARSGARGRAPSEVLGYTPALPTRRCAAAAPPCSLARATMRPATGTAKNGADAKAHRCAGAAVAAPVLAANGGAMCLAGADRRARALSPAHRSAAR